MFLHQLERNNKTIHACLLNATAAVPQMLKQLAIYCFFTQSSFPFVVLTLTKHIWYIYFVDYVVIILMYFRLGFISSLKKIKVSEVRRQRPALKTFWMMIKKSKGNMWMVWSKVKDWKRCRWYWRTKNLVLGAMLPRLRFL